nr:MAG TPA: hypothetical protein [Caudoviricetes sp.]
MLKETNFLINIYLYLKMQTYIGNLRVLHII